MPNMILDPPATAPALGPDPREASQLAQTLARNCGYAGLPCSADGQPLVPLRQASTLTLSISNAWLRTPGPLIGVATGQASGVWVVEISAEGSDWWAAHHDELPPTRTYETPRAGLQLFDTHGHGIPSTRGHIHKGVDTFGDGSHVVIWFAAGFECLDHEAPQPFPASLRALLVEAAP